jgi:ribonuclease Z
MDVTLLGTGNPIPDPERAGAATLVRGGGHTLLFDCGRAVTMRLAGAGVGAAALSALLITHLHSDHIWSFNDLLTTRWIGQFASDPFLVVGPPGTAEFVDRSLAAMATDIGYRMDHHDDLNWEPACDVSEVTEGAAFEDDGVRATAAVVDHGVVRPALAYRVDADGAAVVISGDTLPCPGLDRLCAGADIYVQTVLRQPLVEQVPLARFQDILDYHSSTEDAAATAARGGVKKLVLTHLIPTPAPGTEQDWIDDVRPTFDGEVIVGHDLLTVTA